MYVLRWPLDVDPAYANYGSAMAILLGLPAEMNPPQALQLASAEGEALLGPHTFLQFQVSLEVWISSLGMISM